MCNPLNRRTEVMVEHQILGIEIRYSFQASRSIFQAVVSDTKLLKGIAKQSELENSQPMKLTTQSISLINTVYN